MTRFLMGVAPFAIIAAPAFAQANTDASVAAAQAAAPAVVKPHKVCRKFEVTGRRIAQTECHSAEQWAEYDRANADAAQKFVTDINTSSARGSSLAGATGGLNMGAVFGVGPQ